jgi:hypothetical protein
MIFNLKILHQIVLVKMFKTLLNNSKNIETLIKINLKRKMIEKCPLKRVDKYLHKYNKKKLGINLQVKKMYQRNNLKKDLWQVNM